MFWPLLIFFFILVIISTAFVCLEFNIFIPPVSCLKVISGEGKQLLSIAGVDKFQLVYTHSVARTPVKEYYEIQYPNLIIQTRMDYHSYGAGLPTKSSQNYQLIDGAIVIDGMANEHSEIPVRVGRVSEQKIVFNEKSIPLIDLAKPGKLLIIKPGKLYFRFDGFRFSK